jgi:mono/diheme cytochrome c family protein
MNRLNHMSPLLAAGALLLATAALVTDPALAADGDAAQIARGKYLVTTSACHDCHTPWHIGPGGPEPDMSRMLSGHPESLVIEQPATLSSGPWTLASTPTNTAWSGAWGVSFTANLTPDAETGLGKWTLTTFMQAIRTGRHMGRGRQILPPMPFPMYRNFTDEDFAAIFAYLRSIPPIKNRVPEPLPPGPTPAAAEK